ncbi:uncharacterized protein LOC135495799 isoform X2 [Lineus longissimus]|uniref:uncharacterized protein LOC135495799 isoform X2 n=1 Tax=Lineus longissimus TaxID=88925 RepID=UPI002B4C258F
MESTAWLVAALVLLPIYQAASMSKRKNYYPYYMEGNCGKTLYTDETGVVDVYLTKNFGYEPRSCNFTVKTRNTRHQVQAHIIQVDTNHQKFTSCQTSDNLQLYSVNEDRNRLLTGDGVCGTEVNSPHQMIESDQTAMLLAFTSQGITDVPYRGFHLRITEFHPAECQPDEFTCGNYKCIKSFLTCDDVDNCGDKTDEDGDMAGCKLSRRHSKRDVNSNDVITKKEINDMIRAHPGGHSKVQLHMVTDKRTHA